MKWRVGKKIKLNVYGSREEPVCQCHTEEHAALIVNAINKLPPCNKHVESQGAGYGTCPLPEGHPGSCMFGAGD